MALEAAERVAILQGGKVSVGRQVDSVTASTVDSYVNAWAAVRDDLVESAADAARLAQEAGDPRNPAAYRTARLTGVLDELTTQLERLGMRAGVAVTDLVAPIVAVPQEVLRDLRVAGAPVFGRVPAPELGAIIRRQQEVIASRYLVLSSEAERAMRDALLQGVARGSGTDEVARAMVRRSQAATAARLGIGSAAELEGAAASVVAQVRQAFAGGLDRATNLARTELIDASRVATTASYLASPDVVAGWEWLATLDDRTCGACWGMHGEVFAPDVFQEGHQSCRCVQSPLLVGETPGGNGLQDRDEAFRNLPREGQLRVLGPGRLAAYEDGVPLRAMATRRDNVGWRAGQYVTPVRDLPSPGAPPRPASSTPAPSAPAVPANLRDLDDDDLGALMLRDDVLGDDAELQRITDELDRRDALEVGPRDAAQILADKPRDQAEAKIVADYFGQLQAADDAARLVAGRDSLPAPRARDSKEQATRMEYEAMLEHLMMSATSETNGRIFSRAGVRDKIDDRALFEGSAEDSVRYASEELRAYWLANPGSRMTYTEFRAPGSRRAATIRNTLAEALQGDRDPQTGRRTRRARAR